MNKLLYISALCLIFSLSFVCNSKPKKDNYSINRIDWDKIKIDSSFYIKSINDLYSNIKKQIPNSEVNNLALDNLFSDSTIIENSRFNWGHPNNLKGTFYKRLNDIGNNKVLLFTYLDSTIYEEYCKIITMEIQSFNIKDSIVDKLIVLDTVRSEGYSWFRTFNYLPNNILKIRDQESIESEDSNILQKDSTNIYFYQIKENGKIVRYYDKSNGFYNDFPFKEKGLIQNHYKEGLWQKNIYSENNQLIGIYFMMYHQGEKEGEALYYTYEHKRTWEGLSLEYGEKYHNNRLIENTIETSLDPEKFSIYQKCDSIIESMGINKSVERVFDE